MVELKRSECAILPLVLKGKWFDMVASGEKLEEYRSWDVWHKRINNWLHRFCQTPQVKHLVVAFLRGYRKPSMWLGVTCVSSDRVDRDRHPEWGEPAEPHFVILLGDRVTLRESSR